MNHQPQASSQEGEELFKSYDKHCRMVENTALLTVHNMHVPVMNTMRCLTKSDCWNLLNKYRPLCNVIEQSVVLVALTDFVTCVCANPEMFPMFIRKHDKKGIQTLLMLLQSHWIKFLARVTDKDMTVNQMSSIVLLLKECVRRVEDRDIKVFVEVIVKNAESAVTVIKNPIVREVKKPVQPVSKTNCIPPSKISVLKPNVAASKPVKAEHISNKKIKPKKGPFNISDFVLKSCENTVLGKVVENPPKKPHQKEKQNADGVSILPSKKSAKQATKNHLTMERKIVVIECDVPPTKKPCVENHLANGKVNAFKRLMEKGKKDKRSPEGKPAPAPAPVQETPIKNAFDLLMKSQKAKCKKGKLDNERSN